MDNFTHAEPVVMLVDHRDRDLDQATLIAHHLRTLGVECILEPLEAFRAALGAHRPGMIIFNHLLGSQLVEWSKRLADVGVQVAVLLNEGIAHNEEEQRYLAGRFHNGAHIDHFFCWNAAHRDALMAEGYDKATNLQVVGVPRFDFYFEPWSRVVRRPEKSASGRPDILVCTNFGLAPFKDRPRDQVERFFSAWATRVSLYRDYWGAIDSNWNARNRFLDFLAALIDSEKFEITLRPHPREEFSFYENWHLAQPEARRKNLRLDSGRSVSGPLLNCDLEISGESCTTAVEAWILKKPTVELVFDRNVYFYLEERSRGNVHCADPSQIVEAVERSLREPIAQDLVEERKKYLEKWCATPGGMACKKIAETIATAIKKKQPGDWSKLDFNDYRRAAKLKFYNSLGKPYHFDPLLSLKHSLSSKKYAGKMQAYRKSITPGDVRDARQRFDEILGNAIAKDASVS